jgi:hypothetical protein
MKKVEHSTDIVDDIYSNLQQILHDSKDNNKPDRIQMKIEAIRSYKVQIKK